MRKNEDCIAIYSRKSKFTGKGESIGNQIDLCKEYILCHYGDKALVSAKKLQDQTGLAYPIFFGKSTKVPPSS